ncbi:MAG: S8 family serine peptidase, partial [Myxococcota bacterium]
AARRVALPAPSDRNHGHWVASLIGADFDPVPPLGTHPDPTATLDLVGIDYGSVGGALDTLVEMDKQLPRDGFFVLSTSFGFSASVPEATRRIAAIAWREAVLSRQTRFLHLTSSGNEGILDPAVTTSGSAFALQARVVDLDRDAAGTVIDGVEDAWEQAMERQPALRRVAGRTLVVGASDGNGLESSFSNRGADLRMIGRGLTGVCVERGEGCVEVGGRRLVTQNGTSGATPLAAGLAAWAHAIDPSLTADTLADRLLDHDDGRWVDALSLTLSLETPALPVREAMLDVLGDGTFDEQDLEAFLALFDTPDEALDQPPLWSAADLNGDGRARTNTALPVDLDGDGRLTQLSLEVPSADAGPRTVRLDERDVTDLDFLCWGAYAGPFRGDTAARDARLGPLCETREAVLELTGINARSFSMIRVDPAFTGQTESEASFDDERVEGRFLEWRDPEGDQPLHPEGGFSRTRGVDSFVFGTVPCNPASGTCLGPSTAFDGDADSSVVWTCTRDLVSQPTVCQFLTASSARAVVGPGTSPNGAANRVLSQSFVSLVFLVREPVDYVIEIDDVQIERDGPEPLSVFGSAAEVELRTVYRRFDGDGAPFETGSPTGTLMPGEHVFSVTVSSGATPWFDTEVSASATHQGAITFTRR